MIKLYKSKNVTKDQAIMFCDKFFIQLTKQIIQIPANDMTLISTHLIYMFSQNQQITSHIVNSPYIKQLNNTLFWMGKKVNQLTSYGSYFTLLLGILINFTVQQPSLLTIQFDTSNISKLLNQNIDEQVKLNVLFYLQQVSQNRQNLSNALLNNILQVLLNYRQNTQSGIVQDSQQIQISTSILLNSFLHLKDNYQDQQLVNLFKQHIQNIIQLFTTKNYYNTYINSLKDEEKEFGVSIPFLKDNESQLSIDILSKLTDCLYLFVRADKIYLKQYYPLLRETHMYYTDLYGQSELNDQLNAVITHVVSD